MRNFTEKELGLDSEKISESLKIVIEWKRLYGG